ncbi:hypothetical protein MKI84_01775 [Ancylobacter sp. A5.8]|uniref:hypothetical protein n=1 Tax=Ancylobacter gelatini TaxID=2919920 RepID=UPI001F4DAEE2|nr:hypothetical protein [Ancylobacter gelatini]MCJ8141637.1 hypothetical protein [Ancylobacter gelatini]
MKMAIFAAGLACLLLETGTAVAGCELVTNPCSTDSAGNTYITQKSIGGTGYVTTQNGNPYSHTGQTLGGGWREEFTSGGYQMHSTNPYQPVGRPKTTLGW